MLTTAAADNASPTALDTASLTQRLARLAGDERALQVEFLLHLEEFDRRRAWAEVGFPSLWEWMLRALHLREGAAGRRIAAMRVLRRFPVLAEHVRDGRLCISTVALLGSVVTEENFRDVAERAAFMTKAQVERLVATIAPRAAPKEGLRKVVARGLTPSTRVAPSEPLVDDGRSPGAGDARHEQAGPVQSPTPARTAATTPAIVSRPAVRPVDATTYSLRVTVDQAFKAELEMLKDLLAHKVPDGDLGAVLREAVRCAVEKYRRRKGALEPSRERKASAASQAPPAVKEPGRRAAIPAAIRREVWRRAGGRCAWRGPDGLRCGSTWKLEFDHIRPVALGGPSTVENLQLVCFAHNQLNATQVFGRQHMERARAAPPPRASTIPSRSERLP